MNRAIVSKAVETILAESGADLHDENFAKTPARVAKAFEEFFEGYNQDPVEILKSAMFKSEGQNLIIAKDIRYYSMCCHHMVPFFGTAHVGYIPTEKIVGLSKIPRVVQAVTRRLQLQERITEHIAQSVDSALNPTGVMVVVTGKHMCYQARGIQTPDTVTITSAVRGVFKDDFNARNEFLSLAGYK